jgi:nitrate reductase / nitrite oxidoreductase, alpha subunit
MDPIAAWEYISQDPKRAKRYKSVRGLGGFVRADWDTVTEIIAAANAFTIKKFGPDRLVGFPPIPAMSMVSYAAGARYLSLLGGTCLSFYDWYCDLPPASPQVWGEQTDVPESADWYNSTYLMVLGSNVPQTRTPDAHFYTEVCYKGAKTVAVSSDYGEMVKFGDIWLAPKQGTDAALAMAMGHVILKEFHLSGKSEYFRDYVKQYTDMPMLVMLRESGEALVPDQFLRASHLAGNHGQTNNPEWKTLSLDAKKGNPYVPNGTIGLLWSEGAADDGKQLGRWNLEQKDAVTGEQVDPVLTLFQSFDEIADVSFPYFGSEHGNMLVRKIPAKRMTLADGGTVLVSTVYDLQMANYGVDRGLGGQNVASSFDDDVPYTPAWQEKHTTVPRAQVIQVAREFAQNAHDTHGKSMVIVGGGAEPLVSHGYDVLRHYQYVDDVRLRRSKRWRLGALRGAGKTASAIWLDTAGIRFGLVAATAPDERHQFLLRAH